MNLGIDIGSIKTVISSTKDNGVVMEDDFGKKEIKTVIERTSPHRAFGNSVSGDATANLLLRRRGFMTDILNPESQENLFMFLNFIDRTIKKTSDYKDACLAIPEFFTEEHKRALVSLVEMSSLKASTFMSHVTAVAACAALRNLQIASEFMIIDCGYSKTSAGLFKFAEGRLTPLRRWHIKRGAQSFDEAVFSILIKKYDLSDSMVTREKIFKEINVIKRGLNTLELVKTRIITDKYDMMNMEITRSEYLEALGPVLGELKSFFAQVKDESGFSGYTEVVGNNSNNAFIQEMLSTLSYNTTLNTSESASLGACLALAVNSRKMQFGVDEILGYDIHVRIEGEEVKPTLLISACAPLAAGNIKVKYNRKGSFSVEVLESLKKIGTIRVSKPETKAAETVVISMRTTPFMTVEVVSVNIPDGDGDRSLEFSYETFSVDKATLKRIEETDREITTAEETKRTIDGMRNHLENLLDSFDRAINKVFPGLISQDDMKVIEGVRDAFFDSQPVTTTVKEEEKVRSDIMASLKFVSDRLKGIEDEVRKEGQEILKNFDTEVVSKIGTGVASNRVQNTIYRLRGFLQMLRIDIENVHLFNRATFDGFKADIAKETKIAIAEEEKRKADEIKKANDDKANDGKKAADAKADDGKANDGKTNDGKANNGKTGENKKQSDSS